MSALSWPLASHFSTILQKPAVAFRAAELKPIVVEKDNLNQPRAWSGAFATVYKGSFGNGSALAIRVFTSAASERRERYQAIASFLQGRKIEPLVGFTYRDDGIRSAGDGKFYPLVTMEWVSGETLFKWVARQCRDKNRKELAKAADLWVDLVGQLAAAQIAHGDLQHANVMVTDRGRLKLVDYDCMCVPALVGRTNLEIGVDPYQHPARDHETKLSLNLDNYSALFILAALRALAAAPDLWGRFVEGLQYDKLLFRHEDLEDPDHSDLIQALRRSSDADVPRLVDELLTLRKAPLDQVPRLDQVLFSFDKVESLLNARDFDAAVELLARGKKQLAAAPAKLQARLREAQQRVKQRQDLERAVAAGDEKAMQQLYQPKLLDDYPQAQAAVAVARSAAKVAPLIDQLEKARLARAWRQLVQIWDAHQTLLAGRKSAAQFAADVSGWRQRNQLCDTVLALLAQSDVDAAALATSWKQLAALGGHPETNSRQHQVEAILKREIAWTEFQKVPHALRHETDESLVRAWNEKMFAGWTRAERERPRLEAARHRLDAAGQIERQAAQPLSVANEEQLFKLAGGLPDAYEYALKPRVQLAHDRLHVLAKLKRALAEPVSDLTLASLWETLHQLKGRALAPANVKARAATAVERAAVLHILRQIPATYPVEQAPQLDARLLSTWNDSLLAECHDAEPWRATWRQAAKRQATLAEMKKAMAANNKLRIAELAAEDCLTGYPLPHDWARVAKGAIAELRTFRHLLATLQRNDRQAFRDDFDARVLRRHAKEFASYQARLREWILAEVLPTDRLGLAPPLARRGLTREPSGNGTFRICWQWPQPRYSEQCVVAVCREPPRRGGDPRQLAALIRLPVDRKSYEEGGGSRLLHADHDWQGGYVVVWAVVDVGFEQFASEPLVLGRLEAPAAKSSARWTF
ncbi:MAG TPA: hypothetical protein VF306_16020 [Pirellulales bacterium]